MSTPFTDPSLITGSLYTTADRLARRTGALHAAKIRGADATDTIVDLVGQRTLASPVVCDIGCGRGTTTARLASCLSPARLIALDRSRALLAVVAERTRLSGQAAETVCADFHHLPLTDAGVDVAIAAFCLYHSPRPEHVIGEIARCLAPAGRAVLVTKSADSYQEIDELIAVSGLDPDAADRTSLYASFHGDMAAEVTAAVLRVDRVVRQRHVFRFDGLEPVGISSGPGGVIPAQSDLGRGWLAQSR